MKIPCDLCERPAHHFDRLIDWKSVRYVARCYEHAIRGVSGQYDWDTLSEEDYLIQLVMES
jgi:hypothetical protein